MARKKDKAASRAVKPIQKKSPRLEKVSRSTVKVVKTEARYLPISERKMRLVIKAVKNLQPDEALEKLEFINKKGARFLIKAIKTALADAENNFGLERKGLAFKEILANQGPSLKRRDKSHGARFHSGIIRRNRTHLVIKLVSRNN